MASRQEGSGATDAVTSCDASLEASRSISNQQRPHTHILRTGLIHLAMSNHTLALQPSSEKLCGGIWSYPNPNPNIKAGGKCFPSGSNYSWVLEEGRSFSTLMAAISCQHVKVDLGTLGGGVHAGILLLLEGVSETEATFRATVWAPPPVLEAQHRSWHRRSSKEFPAGLHSSLPVSARHCAAHLSVSHSSLESGQRVAQGSLSGPTQRF